MATSKNTKASATSTRKPAAASASAPAPTASPPPAVDASSTITTTGNANHATKVDLEAAYQGLVVGLRALYKSTDTFDLKSGVYTRDALITSFQSFVAAAEKTKAANVAWRQCVQAERAVELTVRPLRSDVKAQAVAKFGKDGTQLMQLGFKPTAPGKKTVAVKSAAVAKSKATRVARSTRGRKEKLEVTGNVTGIQVVPITIPASASPPAQQASSTSSAAPTGPATK